MSTELGGQAIAEAFAAARATWPGVGVDPARFDRHLRAQTEGPEAVPLATLHPGDVYLALACAAGDAPALAAFEAQLGPEILRSLGKLRLRGPAAAEIHQRLRHKLFIAADGAEPRIAAYSGRGPLRAWLRALVAHEALDEHRRAARQDHDTDSALGELPAGDDPELLQIRARYTGPFRDAFRDALAELSPRDRNVLRLVYTEGLSVEQVALLYEVHRVSVSRWLGQTRRNLLELTRDKLRERLRLDEAELASLTRLCLSQIDVSLDRLLAR